MKRKSFWGFCLLWPAVIITGCMTSSWQTQDQALPSANAIGIYDSNKNALLRPAFINGVNVYLSRYAPVLIEQRNDYVKMTARYDYQLNIELLVKETEYEIIVTVAQDWFSYGRAQKICVKIANGVNQSFANQLARMAR